MVVVRFRPVLCPASAAMELSVLLSSRATDHFIRYIGFSESAHREQANIYYVFAREACVACGRVQPSERSRKLHITA